MFEGGGNIPIILPVVARLVARGHDVAILAGPNIRRPAVTKASDAFVERIVATGARPIRLPEPSVHPQEGFKARGFAFGWSPRPVHKAGDVARTARWSTEWAQGVRARVRDERPDVLAVDYFLLGALAAGEHAQVPTAALIHTSTVPWPLPGLPPPGTGFPLARTAPGHLRDQVWAAAYRRVARREGLHWLNQARAELGLEPLDGPYRQYERATRVLVLGPQEFDFPARRLPKNVRYVGMPFDDAAPPEWTSPWPADDPRPMLLISLSTLPQGQGPLLQRVLDAVGEMAVRALVTVGPSLDKSQLQAPPNAHLETFVPHSAVLPHVDAVITQCGFSTLTKALTHGLPVLCLPLVGDQPDNAARVVALGVGLRLSAESTAAQLRSAMNALLNDRGLGEAARTLAGSLRSQDGADAAAQELEAL